MIPSDFQMESRCLSAESCDQSGAHRHVDTRNVLRILQTRGTSVWVLFLVRWCDVSVCATSCVFTACDSQVPDDMSWSRSKRSFARCPSNRAYATFDWESFGSSYRRWCHRLRSWSMFQQLWGIFQFPTSMFHRYLQSLRLCVSNVNCSRGDEVRWTGHSGDNISVVGSLKSLRFHNFGGKKKKTLVNERRR